MSAAPTGADAATMNDAQAFAGAILREKDPAALVPVFEALRDALRRTEADNEAALTMLAAVLAHVVHGVPPDLRQKILIAFGLLVGIHEHAILHSGSFASWHPSLAPRVVGDMAANDLAATPPEGSA